MSSMHDYPEGTEAVCIYCGQSILLDQREGGGPGKDWGATPKDWVGNGGIGMDYGCDRHPESDKDGVHGHEPIVDSITEMVELTVRFPRKTVERLHGTTTDYWTDGCGSLQVDGYDTINIQYADYGDEAAEHVGDVAEHYLLAVLNAVRSTIEAIGPYMDEQITNDLNQLRTELEGNR